MSESISTIKNNLEQELDIIHALRRKYPYLGSESESVGSEIEHKLNQLSRYNNVTDYAGPSYNLINYDSDDISVATAKMRAQLDWINVNQPGAIYSKHMQELDDLINYKPTTTIDSIESLSSSSVTKIGDDTEATSSDKKS